MSTANMYRMLPDPKKGGGAVNTKGGSKVTVAHDSYVDMSFDDAYILPIGWTNCGVVGTTAQRPINAPANTHYLDTTLSKCVFSDGQGNWRDPFTGGIV